MSETGPSPTEEAEKEAQGIALAQEIAALKASAKTDEDFQVILCKIRELKELFGLISKEEILSPDIAKEIMNANLTEEEKEAGMTDFLGPETISAAFGPEAVPAEIPPILFSPEELRRARELGQFLILRSNQIPDDKLELPNTKQTLEKAPTGRWALVTKEIIPDSTDKNYLEQTEQLIKYLREQVFADVEIPAEYQEAISEFEAQKEELRPLAESREEEIWEPAAERLANLKISRLTRQSYDEVLYDLELYKQINDRYLLPNMYTWTSSRPSDGSLVLVGSFASVGVFVSWDRPGASGSDLGAVFSRSF